MINLIKGKVNLYVQEKNLNCLELQSLFVVVYFRLGKVILQLLINTGAQLLWGHVFIIGE